MAISRMQQPRQQYGLGSLVKKAVRGVKKIVKSPLGKAALGIGLAGMPFGGGSWFGAGSGFGKLSGMMKGIGAARNIASMPAHLTRGMGGTPASGGGGFFTKGLGRFLNPWSSGKFSGKHAFGLGAAALTAMPFLMGKDDPEEEVVESWTSLPSSIANIRDQARAHYTNPSASTLAFMPNKQFVDSNWYAADGGRAGLMNGGEPGQEQMEQMLMAEFVKYKNQGGKLTFEQFVQAVMQQQQEQQGGGMEQPQEVAMAANGGRIGYANGGDFGSYKDFIESTGDEELMKLYSISLESGDFTALFDALKKKGYSTDYADGGRIGYKFGEMVEGIEAIEGSDENMLMAGMGNVMRLFENYDGSFDKGGFEDMMIQYSDSGAKRKGIKLMDFAVDFLGISSMKDGGRIGYSDGGSPFSMLEIFKLKNLGFDIESKGTEPFGGVGVLKDILRVNRADGGIMETEAAEEMIDMGGQEKDYRETGGFVEIGGKERADDVPARLSKNEFVFTADAVRAAGGGDIDAGSEVMQNMMENLEAGGEISEESQGLEGAQAMYDQQQMLQSRIA